MGVLQPQQTPEHTAYLWPDNLQAWACWQGLQTQWRVGIGGPTGLDYAGVRAYLDEQEIDGGSEARRDIWRGIQAAEAATLEVWAERREREQASQQPSPLATAPRGL